MVNPVINDIYNICDKTVHDISKGDYQSRNRKLNNIF